MVSVLLAGITFSSFDMKEERDARVADPGGLQAS
jgi:hypothetical protein